MHMNKMLDCTRFHLFYAKMVVCPLDHDPLYSINNGTVKSIVHCQFCFLYVLKICKYKGILRNQAFFHSFLLYREAYKQIFMGWSLAKTF